MAIDEGAPAEQFDDLAQQQRAGLLGMWVFLATELLLFGGYLALFGVERVRHTDAFATAAGHLDLTLATVNTALLITSGLTMVLAERTLEARRRHLTLTLLVITMSLGLGFLAIKGLEWYHEYQQGLVPLPGLRFQYSGEDPAGAELFFNFYFGLTGLHAVHLVIGVGLLAVLAVWVWRWRDPGRLARQSRIIGLYWGVVDVIWVCLFTLLYLLRS